MRHRRSLICRGTWRSTPTCCPRRRTRRSRPIGQPSKATGSTPRVVGSGGRARDARDHGPVRLGEGARRPGPGIGLVGGAGGRGHRWLWPSLRRYGALGRGGRLVYGPLALSLVQRHRCTWQEAWCSTSAVAPARWRRPWPPTAPGWWPPTDHSGWSATGAGRLAGVAADVLALPLRGAVSTPLAPDSCSTTCRRIPPWPRWPGWSVPAVRSSPRPGRGTRDAAKGRGRRRGLLGVGPARLVRVDEGGDGAGLRGPDDLRCRRAGRSGRGAGLGESRVSASRLHVVVAYRLATPQIAPWVGTLDPPARAELVRQALVAVQPHAPGWRPAAVLLAGRVMSQPS